MLYLFPFFISLLVSIGLTYLIALLGRKIKFKSRLTKRHKHKKNVSRFGGIAIIIAFIIALILDPNLVISVQLWGVVVASCFILLFGFWDDVTELDWKTQLFVQIAIALFIFIIGVRVNHITNPFGGVIALTTNYFDFIPFIGENFAFGLLLPSLAFGLLWIIFVMNAMNWADGIDGLSGGITLIGALTIFILSLTPEVNQPPVGIISMALAGSVLGFLIFNFHPAKIFAGTSGSMFMGFMLASLAIFAGTKIATALMVMTIPLIDAVWVIFERLRHGQPIFKPDNRHIHYKLMDLGWSPLKVSVLLYGITFLIAIVALNTRTVGKFFALLIAMAVMFIGLFLISKKLKDELGKYVS